ncbi:MAG: hypothetical protein E6K46_10800, partial [Gammaproteobacteria bacterium]
DALPEEVKRLFRNCRLVGRRFRLAHVFFGRDIIEVATFRATSAPSQGDEPLPEADPEDGEAPELDDPDLEAEPVPAQARAPLERPSRGRGDAEPGAATEVTFDASGRILRDNVYGTIDEDVWRRDFTVNALYYNIADFSLWDYVGGAEDIKTRTLRLIGDPETRFPGRAQLRGAAQPGTPRGDAADGGCLFREPPRKSRGEAAAAGPQEHRRPRPRRQAGDADLPLRTPFIWTHRGHHRVGASRALA